VNGRFAPSPTGVLHLGNLRTALLAWLFARSSAGGFLVRMEDLDAGRVREPYYAEQLADLAALGIDWDGEVVRQSERTALYEAAIARLDVYECFCTRAEIREAVSAPHGPLPEGAYPGTCRHLSDSERTARRASGRRPALRVAAEAARVAFTDRLLGPDEGIVDDADQGVEEIVRGADLLDSTPRQLWLARALRLPEPRHAHVPLVLGPDGARLAKRHGAVTLRDVEPARALAWMAETLGMRGRTASELLADFRPERLPREPTAFTGVG
jgi:glutamyl-tRNA synthetase